MVEPIPSEAEKLKDKYMVIEKGLWSTNCTKKLYVTGKNWNKMFEIKLIEN